MKNMLLFFLGCIPFLVGHIMSYLMSTVYYDKLMPFNIIAITFLICWFIIAKLIAKFTKTSKYTTMIVHIPAFVVLVLTLFQELILQHYWTSFLGISMQYFYLPLIPLAQKFIIFGVIRGCTACLVAFLLMYGTFYFGCKPKKRKDIMLSDWSGS